MVGVRADDIIVSEKQGRCDEFFDHLKQPFPVKNLWKLNKRRTLVAHLSVTGTMKSSRGTRRHSLEKNYMECTKFCNLEHPEAIGRYRAKKKWRVRG